MLAILMLEQVVFSSSEDGVASRFRASEDGSACKRRMALTVSFQISASMESFGAPGMDTAISLFMFESDMGALIAMVSSLIAESVK